MIPPDHWHQRQHTTNPHVPAGSRNLHRFFPYLFGTARRASTMKTAALSLEEVLAQLEAWGHKRGERCTRAMGEGDNQFGATLGKLRGLAKKLKTNHELVLQLRVLETPRR